MRETNCFQRIPSVSRLGGSWAVEGKRGHVKQRALMGRGRANVNMVGLFSIHV
jgi:hypothetical protein